MRILASIPYKNVTPAEITALTNEINKQEQDRKTPLFFDVVLNAKKEMVYIIG